MIFSAFDTLVRECKRFYDADRTETILGDDCELGIKQAFYFEAPSLNCRVALRLHTNHASGEEMVWMEWQHPEVSREQYGPRVRFFTENVLEIIQAIN